MATEIKRPGGALANRPLYFFWIVDCSGSMHGDKIGTLNHAIQSCIPEMADAAEDNPNAQLLIRTLRFADNAQWMTPEAVPVENFVWEDLEASGCTAMGEAFSLLADQLTIPPMSDRALPPVLVLVSDGCPTDNFIEPLNKLLHLPWGKKSVRIAISVGKDADDEVLAAFTGSKEMVLQANNASSLTKMIKWASTAASAVSSPASMVTASMPAMSMPMSSVAGVDVDPAEALLNKDTIAPAIAPVVLDMDSIIDPNNQGYADIW